MNKNKKMHLIGISGKAGVGKDLVGGIIQYLIARKNDNRNIKIQTAEFLGLTSQNWMAIYQAQNWEIKKFADKLKDIVCLLIGCTREQLEDREFKEKELEEEWWYWKPIEEDTGDLIPYRKPTGTLPYNLIKLTPRLLLQLIGTECGRQIIHPNIWVNVLFSKYKPNICSGVTHCALAGKFEISCNLCPEYPNWIITDCRFPNELKAVKDRGGITIRVNRESELYYKYNDVEVEQKLISMGYEYSDNDNFDEDAINEGFKWSEKLQRWSFDEDIIVEHESETSLDSATFDFVINNDKDIEHLISEVRKILEKLSII